MKKISCEDVEKSRKEQGYAEAPQSSNSYYIDELEIKGGVLREIDENGVPGVMYYGNNGATCFFRGVRMTTQLVFKGYAYQYNGTIHVSSYWVANGFNIYDFAHEYGHYLQQESMGNAEYYKLAIQSGYSVIANPDKHQNQPFEVQATELGNQYLKEHVRY